MTDLNLLLTFFLVFLSIILMQFFNKQHYWKILLIISLLFFLLLSSEGFVFIVYIATLTYYISLKIRTLKHIRWLLLGLILLPLLIKKIFISEYHFGDFITPLNSRNSLLNIIGLSYITFNAVGYLMDIKRKYIEPQTNFFKLLLFLIYFPIIFSGPLTRAKYFFLEIKNIQLKRDSIVNGLRLLLWGLFKNLVVGSRLYRLLNTLIELELSGLYFLLNGFVFYLFLYCTFSSFINIFQGVSLIFNIQLNENFKNRIYMASSREEFWKGWHITLNNWFKDYFFYETIRFDKKRKHTNLLLFFTFICIALWHDFTLVFLTWGTLNAFWLIAERKYKRYIKLKTSFSFFGILYHTIFASFLATIFISKNIIEVFRTLFDFSEQHFSFELLHTPNSYILILTFGIMDYYERKTTKVRIDKYLGKQHIVHRYFFYYLLCLLILTFAVNSKIVNYYNLF